MSVLKENEYNISDISDILNDKKQIEPITKPNEPIAGPMSKLNEFFKKSFLSDADNISILKYAAGTFIIIFITITSLVILYSKPSKSSSSAGSSMGYFFLFLIIAQIILFVYLKRKENGSDKSDKSDKDNEFKKTAKYLILNAFPTISLVLFIIGLIILFSLLNKQQIHDYAILILIAITLIAGYIFYKNIKQHSSSSSTNIGYERIKFAIIFVCIIFFLIIMCGVDPGGYIKQYMGTSLIAILLLVIFGLLYLLSAYNFPTLPDNKKVKNSILKGFSTFSIISVIFFIAAIVLFTFGIVNMRNNGNDSPDIQATIGILLFIFFIIYAAYFSITLFPSLIPSSADPATTTQQENNKTTTIWERFRSVLLLFLGLGFSGTLIGWLVTIAQNLSSRSGIISFIVNLLVILVILTLVFKLLTLGTYYKQSPLYKLIVNTILYIPCILVSLLDGLNLLAKPGIPGESPTKYLGLLGLTLFGYAIYLFTPYFASKFAKQGGRQLVNKPTYLNKEQYFGSYQSLNDIKLPDASGNYYQNLNGGSGFYNYNYAISFWFYLDSTNPEKDIEHKIYTPILSYGGKPCVQYNPNNNVLMVTMPPDKDVGGATDASTNSISKFTKYDENGNIIIYTKADVLLQKWNNMIINYNGGTLDIFYNGQLVKSAPNVVPYMSQDYLVVGSNKGLNGGICNVVYFNTAIDAKQIYYLYNFVKNKTPPLPSIWLDVVADELAEVTHTETSKTNTNAVIDSILIPTQNVVEKTEAADVVPDVNTFNANNFLSLRWYMTGHGDNYGVP
uniref:Uncharacterized protein n=1 Tax=viral metagenome TaxID=1070528 RepID=A0A6C0HXK8_9ZZZZ